MRTEGTFILAALALHAGLLFVGRALPPLGVLLERDKKPLDVIEVVEIEPIKAATVDVRPDTPSVPEVPQKTEVERPAPDPRVTARNVAPTPTPEGPTTATPEAPPAPTGPKTKFDDLPPDERQGVLGLPGVGGPAWAIPGVLPGAAAAPAPAPTVAPAPRPVDKDIAGIVMRDMMGKKDKEIGLDLPVAGSMASAVSSAVNGTELPSGTNGSIECRVSPNGRVSNCRLVGSNGGNPGAWAEAVRAASSVAGAALSGQYANGAVVTIDVSISQGPPAGKSGGLTGSGATFDLSNLGAHATRKVRATHRVVAAR